MPLPFILGAAAIAAAGYGAKKGYDGYQTSSKADNLMDSVKRTFRLAETEFKTQDKKTETSLNKLGELQLKIGQEFKEFNTIAKALLAKLNQSQQNRSFNVNIPKHQMDEIKQVEFSTTAYIAKLGGAGVAGAAAAYAVYGGVMALGAASTGTAISALSGAAAYNAAMAAIGGGSLAAGGFGMAGGMAVLGATVAAPILAIAGWAYNSHAEESLENAKKQQFEVDKAVSSMKTAQAHLGNVEKYSTKIYESLDAIHTVFNRYLDSLKAMETVIKMGDEQVIDLMADKLLLTINNGYAVAAILADIITTPLFKVKKDEFGDPIIKDNVAEFATDDQGLKILNSDIPNVLTKARTDIQGFDA